MPQALSGEEIEGGYSYTIATSVQQVQEFYDREMPLVGWQPFVVGTGDTGNLLLMYQQGSSITTVAVIAQGDAALVMIVQS